MTRYAFEPGKGRRRKNVYVGKWSETPCRKIDLPYTYDNLQKVLAWGASPQESPYTHQEIAHWCSEWWLSYDKAAEESVTLHGERLSDERLKAAREIAMDVDVQWELFLANSYSFAELQQLDCSTVGLPADWFRNWLSKMPA